MGPIDNPSVIAAHQMPQQYFTTTQNTGLSPFINYSQNAGSTTLSASALLAK